MEIILGSPGLAMGSVSILCAEPYARICEGHPSDAHLWQHWAQVDALSDYLAKNAVLIPRRFRIRAVLIACPALWRRRQPVSGPVAGGVDVSAINRLHPEASSPGFKADFRERFACSLWQVDHEVVSDAVVLCDVDLSAQMPHKRRLFPAVQLNGSRSASATTMHGLATWTEIEMQLGSWITSSEPKVCEHDGRYGFRPSYDLNGVLLA